MKQHLFSTLLIAVVAITPATLAAEKAEQWKVFETSFESSKDYKNPFTDVEVDVIFSNGKGQWKVPAFWDGGKTWKVRFAAPEKGEYTYQVVATDPANKGLNADGFKLKVSGYVGNNPLYKHGKIDVSQNGRHFEHADGTPFFWLGDTWWKCLAKRLTWDGFQELAADRKKKGFSVVQIVAGPYPDEDAFEEMWKNEGGWPYHTRDYKQLNPAYWNYADRRLIHLIDSELVPAIVGAWGRRDCDAMKVAGVDGLKRHWRYLIARYGAYPVVWILAGELHNNSKWGEGPWAEVGRYVRSIDPYHTPITTHTGGGRRGQPGDEHIIDYDMIGGSHNEALAIGGAVKGVISTYGKKPTMPVLVGETIYEGHMQFGAPYVQRNMFWQYVLSGAAGHTYGAAGIWHASVEGDPGCASSAFGGRRTYDWTTWREGMNKPGAAQVGLGKELLLRYPWHRFEPHPEWAEEGSFAAGIPGEVRIIYQPRRSIYNWKGTIVKQVESDVEYNVFYFDPGTGRRFDKGTTKGLTKAVTNNGLDANFDGHKKPLLFEDSFGGSAVGIEAKGDASAWKDYGTPSQRKEGKLAGEKGLLSIVEKVSVKDQMVTVDAKSSAEAGVVLRFQDANNYVVAFYSPQLKGIAIHDRRNGKWGKSLGMIKTPGIGANIRLTAAVTGKHAALLVSDGKKSWRTPAVKVSNTKPGKSGLWLDQIGEQQSFDNFKVSATTFTPKPAGTTGKAALVDYRAPDLPSPQDWILVLEKAKQ